MLFLMFLNVPIYLMALVILFFVCVVHYKYRQLIFLTRYQFINVMCIIIISAFMIAEYVKFNDGMIHKQYNDLDKILSETNDKTFDISFDGRLDEQSDGKYVVGEFVTARLKGETFKMKAYVPIDLASEYDLYKKHCKVTAELQMFQPKRNDVHFDYRTYMIRKGFVRQLFVESIEHCTDRSLTMIEHIQYSQEKFLEKLKSKLSIESVQMLVLLVFGDQRFVDQSMIDETLHLGIYHLFAVSGSHLTMTLGFITLFMHMVKMPPPIRTLIIFSLLFPILILTSFAPSLMRAASLFIVYEITQYTTLKFKPIDYIVIAFLLYILCFPMDVYDLGFQLSFVICLGFVLHFKTLQQIHSPIILFLYINFMTLVYSMFVLYFIQPSTNLNALIHNVWAIPLLQSIMFPIALIIIVFEFIMLPTDLFMFIFNYFVSIYNLMMNMIDTLHFDRWLIHHRQLEGIVLNLTLLLWIIILSFIDRFMLSDYASRLNMLKNIRFYCVLLLLILFIYINHLLYYQDDMVVSFIDVGQGDATLIEHRKIGKNIMVDVGGQVDLNQLNISQPNQIPIKESNYQFTVRDVLKKRGIHHIDAIMLTHFDADHIGNIQYVLKDFTVDKVYIPDIDTEKKLYWLNMMSQYDVDVIPVKFGDYFQFGNTRYTILSPFKDDHMFHNKDGFDNYYSMVVHVDHEVDYLLTGDINRIKETRLLPYVSQFNVDVLKVSHHGSDDATSEELLEAIQPKISVISVGEHNRYQHPNENVIERLNKQNSKIYRTDELGMIEMRNSHDRLKIKHYKDKRHKKRIVGNEKE